MLRSISHKSQTHWNYCLADWIPLIITFLVKSVLEPIEETLTRKVRTPQLLTMTKRSEDVLSENFAMRKLEWVTFRHCTAVSSPAARIPLPRKWMRPKAKFTPTIITNSCLFFIFIFAQNLRPRNCTPKGALICNNESSHYTPWKSDFWDL